MLNGKEQNQPVAQETRRIDSDRMGTRPPLNTIRKTRKQKPKLECSEQKATKHTHTHTHTQMP